MKSKNKQFWILVIFLGFFLISINFISDGNAIIKPYTNNFGLQTSDTTPYDYDFEDDVLGTAPDGWDITGGITVENYDSNQAIQMQSSGESIMNTFVANQTSGSFEFKILLEDFGRIHFYLRQETTDIVHIYFYNDGTCRIYDNDGTDIFVYDIEQWYYFLYYFDTDTDLYDLEVREFNSVGIIIYQDSNKPFLNNVDGADNIYFVNYMITTFYWFDDIDYSWTLEDVDPPTWDNLREFHDPLEFGFNETIFIDVYDETNISDVYIEIENLNYSMLNVIGNTYYYNKWIPTSLGVNYYTIYILDYFNFTTVVEGSILVQNSYYVLLENNISIVFSFILMFSLMSIMLILYFKKKIFLPILIVLLFSIIIGITLLTIENFPATPFFQVFFIIFQTIIFLLTSIDVFNKG